jgi:hypothetical protein
MLNKLTYYLLLFLKLGDLLYYHAYILLYIFCSLLLCCTGWECFSSGEFFEGVWGLSGVGWGDCTYFRFFWVLGIYYKLCMLSFGE